jgi:hypothetical protein
MKRILRCKSRSLRLSLAWLVAGASLLCAPLAQAELGAMQDSIQADQIRFKGLRSRHTEWPMTTHEITLVDGSGIKEYVNAAGQVFAVSWRTRLKPNLELLLGAHYADLSAAAIEVPSGVSGMKRRRSVRLANLVVHQSGRMNAFAGIAYVPALVPTGVDADALR